MILISLQTNEALRLASHLPMRYGLLKLWVTRLLEVGLIHWIYDYMIAESPKYCITDGGIRLPNISIKY